MGWCAGRIFFVTVYKDTATNFYSFWGILETIKYLQCVHMLGKKIGLALKIKMHPNIKNLFKYVSFKEN